MKKATIIFLTVIILVIYFRAVQLNLENVEIKAELEDNELYLATIYGELSELTFVVNHQRQNLDKEEIYLALKAFRQKHVEDHFLALGDSAYETKIPGFPPIPRNGNVFHGHHSGLLFEFDSLGILTGIQHSKYEPEYVYF